MTLTERTHYYEDEDTGRRLECGSDENVICPECRDAEHRYWAAYFGVTKGGRVNPNMGPPPSDEEQEAWRRFKDGGPEPTGWLGNEKEVYMSDKHEDPDPADWREGDK